MFYIGRDPILRSHIVVDLVHFRRSTDNDILAFQNTESWVLSVVLSLLRFSC